MYTQKSPGGSIYPYYYKGGEILGLHFGSFFKDEQGLLNLMKAEEQFIAGPNHHMPVWVDFYETQLTDRILLAFLDSIQRLRTHITRLALVGCSFRDRWRLRRLAKRSGFEIPMPVRFFDDPEEAKTWLVSETA